MENQLNTAAVANSLSAPATEFFRGLIEGNELSRQIGVNRDTISRMSKNPKSGFPKPFKFGQSTYYSISAVRRWIAEQVGIEGDE